jgi:hypothetical protein
LPLMTVYWQTFALSIAKNRMLVQGSRVPFVQS